MLRMKRKNEEILEGDRLEKAGEKKGKMTEKMTTTMMAKNVEFGGNTKIEKRRQEKNINKRENEKIVIVNNDEIEVYGQESMEGVDFVASAREKIMGSFARALETIEERSHGFATQTLEWKQQRSLDEVNFGNKLESLKNSCPEAKRFKSTLLKHLKEIKKHKEFIKKENQNLATLTTILNEEERVLAEKLNNYSA